MRLRHPRTGGQLTHRQSDLLTLARAGWPVTVRVGAFQSQCAKCSDHWFARATWKALECLFNPVEPLVINGRVYATIWKIHDLYRSPR